MFFLRLAYQTVVHRAYPRAVHPPQRERWDTMPGGETNACLDVIRLDSTGYTHVRYAFATICQDYKIRAYIFDIIYTD